MDRAQFSVAEEDIARINSWILGGFGEGLDGIETRSSLGTVESFDTLTALSDDNKEIGSLGSPTGSALADRGSLQKLGERWTPVALRIMVAVEDRVGGCDEPLVGCSVAEGIPRRAANAGCTGIHTF
jgi:hypothetical protein